MQLANIFVICNSIVKGKIKETKPFKSLQKIWLGRDELFHLTVNYTGIQTFLIC